MLRIPAQGTIIIGDVVGVDHPVDDLQFHQVPILVAVAQELDGIAAVVQAESPRSGRIRLLPGYGVRSIEHFHFTRSEAPIQVHLGRRAHAVADPVLRQIEASGTGIADLDPLVAQEVDRTVTIPIGGRIGQDLAQDQLGRCRQHPHHRQQGRRQDQQARHEMPLRSFHATLDFREEFRIRPRWIRNGAVGRTGVLARNGPRNGSSMTLDIGIIGAGTHGTRYLRHARKDVPGMGVAAVCRRNQIEGTALATECGGRFHRESEELIADPAVDAVVVCTPPSSHFDLAHAVLASGKPLLLEKPMTGTLEQARALAAMDQDSPFPLFLAQTLRWNPVLQKVRELWPRLGRIHLIRAAQRLQPTTLAWQQRLAETVGGSVLLTGVHLFDTVRWLSGREFVRVDSRQDRILNPVVEDFFLARAELDDGAIVSLEVSKFTQSRACWLEVVGRDAQIWADYQNGGVLLRQGSREERFDVSAGTPTLPAILGAWLECLRTGNAPPVGVRDGIATLAMVDACYRSSRSGQSVPVEAP